MIRPLSFRASGDRQLHLLIRKNPLNIRDHERYFIYITSGKDSWKGQLERINKNKCIKIVAMPKKFE